MKRTSIVCAIGLALAMAGCQETTSTGPGGKTESGNPAVKKLSLVAATSQTIKQGATDDFAINIKRDNFDDPVTIRLNDLPTGVEVVGKEAVIPSGENSIKVQLKAASDAAVGEHKVKIDATAPGLADNEQTFTLTVKASG
jgi:hypothetical protein